MSCPKALAAAPMGGAMTHAAPMPTRVDVDFGLLADGLAALSSDDGHKQDGKWTARAAQCIAGIADGSKGEQHQGRCLESIADGDGHSRSAHKGSHAANGIGDLVNLDNGSSEKADVELGTDGIEDSADQQRAEQPLGHGAQGVNPVPLGGDDNVFASEEAFEPFHG